MADKLHSIRRVMGEERIVMTGDIQRTIADESCGSRLPAASLMSHFQYALDVFGGGIFQRKLARNVLYMVHMASSEK